MKPADLTACTIAMLAYCLPAHATVICSSISNTAVPATTPTANFEDHGDGTVTDTTTGLMWMRCSLGKGWHGGTSCVSSAEIFNWQSALQVAQTVNSSASYSDNDLALGFAGHTDWRLPSKNELASIVEERCGAPALNEGLFPNTEAPWWFWSSTPYARSANQAWLVNFAGGNIDSDLKTGSFKVRLVRAGR